MAFYKRRGLGAVTIDTSLPWYDQVLSAAGQLVDSATQKPTQSVNALTAEVANTRQTVLYVALGIGALILLRGSRGRR